MAKVVLSGVQKSYSSENAAVKQLDLEVDDQEFLVLVGPSGCGKSTTLRMIAGLESVTAGEIRVADRRVNDLPPKARDLAMVFQNYALYPHMSVYKNMSFGLELRYGGGWLSRALRRLVAPRKWASLEEKRRQIPERIRQAAETLGIEPLLNRKPHQLSGGERQRVALGRSMVREPAVFLFDEPLSNLDARLRTEMRSELKRLHRHLKVTMIYVTHDQVEALTLGNRVAVMNEGRLLQVGPPMEVYDSPQDVFVAEFIGSPGMNFLLGTLVGTDSVRFESGSLSLQLSGQIAAGLAKYGRENSRPQVILGIRPEDVSLEHVQEGAESSIPGNGLENSEPDGRDQTVRPSSGFLGQAEVLAVDRLGESSIVHLEVDADRVTYRELQSRGFLDEARSSSLTGDSRMSQDSSSQNSSSQNSSSQNSTGMDTRKSKRDAGGQSEKQGRFGSSGGPKVSDGGFVARVIERQRMSALSRDATGGMDGGAIGRESEAGRSEETHREIWDQEGVKVQIRLDLERVHFFDPATGKNILKAGR